MQYKTQTHIITVTGC